jgi:hypothetical protein
MKKFFKLIGIIALIAIIGFSFAACGGDDEDVDTDNTKGGLETKNLTIAGTFDSQNGGSNAKFSASTAQAHKSQLLSRALTAQDSKDFTLEGLLEDGDIVFRLKGSYNSVTKTYSLSAASSILRYSISGGFKDSGIAETGKAIVQVKAGAEWTTIEVPVAVTGTAPSISSGGEVVDELAKGIPENLRGNWRYPGNDKELYAIVTAFSVIYSAKQDGKWIEYQTVYFTDINTAGGITSGITGYKSFDYDALIATEGENWMQKVFNDYVEKNSLYYYSYNNIEALYTKTPQFKSYYPTLKYTYSWSYLNIDLMFTFEDGFRTWLTAQNFDWAKGDYYSDTRYLDAMLAYQHGTSPGSAVTKAACIAAGAEASLSINDGPSYSQDWWFEFSMRRNAWADVQDFLTNQKVWELINKSGYEFEWVSEKYGDSLIVQFYEKRAMKLNNGRLILGQYYKEGAGQNDFTFTSYSQASALTEVQWDEWSALSR